MIHAFQLLFVDCNYPKAFVWWIGGHAVMFYFLFSQFYNETYKDDKKSKKIKKTKDVRSDSIDSQCSSIDDESKYNVGICFTTQTSLYDDSDKVRKIKKSYKVPEENNSLRNRVFINSTISTAES
ncbi:hypothetical protein HHI36_008050 [Cryptolaemus montrouzieri]|uniref:Very-long-chain 3-oxoacyl-CoA synthase n=1 Tax=Cryptolaemus montrouzieri TaxID=559131 RepID=A0ABD2MRE6_9CUCU